MKINIANPTTGQQKLIDIDDEKLVRVFYEKRISQEVPADSLGQEFKGYVFKITGGADRDGFAMKQGVLTNTRVRLLLDGSTGHYKNRRDGDKRRKSIRGCICGSDLAVVNVIITKKGENDIEGLTDKPTALRLGPKRATNIRKKLLLEKGDEVRGLFTRVVPGKEGKKDKIKTAKVQRLVTPTTLRRKKVRMNLKKQRYQRNQERKAEYEKLVSSLRKTQRQSLLSKKRVSTTSK